MLSRRCRIQARPNLKPGLAATKRSKAVAVVTEATVTSTKTPTTATVPSPSVQTDSLVVTDAEPLCEEASIQSKTGDDERIISYPNVQHTSDNAKDMCPAGTIPEPVAASSSLSHEKKISLVEHRISSSEGHNVGHDDESTGSQYNGDDESRSSTPLRNFEIPRKTRRKFTGEEPLDPKKMTMHDLISWNPKNDTMMKYHAGDRGRKASVVASSDAPLEETSSKKVEGSVSSLPAPKVRIAEDGSLVLDETSLTVAQDKSANIWETVDEDRVVRKISSLSFRKSALRKGTPWTDLETELFYLILRATGPDFGLMHEFFPSRSRSELKSKFNREERSNWDRLKHSLSTPTLLDNSLYDQANELLNKIKDEAVKKKEDRQAKKVKKASRSASVDWNEEEADLIAEAEEEIMRMQDENEEQLSDTARKRHKKSCKDVAKNMKEKIIEETSKEAKRIILDRRRRKYHAEVKKLSESSIGTLSPDFPKFKLLYDDDATLVSIELDGEQIPVVKVPLGTTVRVLPEDDAQPERVLFECHEDGKSVTRKFIVKHQSGPREPSSGFLHLFGSVS